MKNSHENKPTRNTRRKHAPAARSRGKGKRRLVLEQLESRRMLSIDGVVVTDDIYPANDLDQHYFSISSQDLSDVGGEYVVTVSLSGGLGGFQPVARMQAPSGSLIGSEIDAGSSQTFKLTVAGNYVIKVQDNDLRDTGTYALALEGIKPPSLDAQTIALGERKTAAIDLMGEVDEYTFTATAGNIVTLSLSESHPGSRATLFSPSGDKVKLYSASTGNRVSQVAAGNKVLSEALQAGTYVIQVYDNNYKAVGGYELSLEGLVPASADAVALTSGETKTGDIAAGEVDAYKFTAAGGNVVTVSLSDVVSGTNSRLWAEVYSPSGKKVAKLPGTNGPDEVENGNKVVYRLPAESGTYVIQVYDYDYTHLEAYGVTLEGLNPPSLDAVAIGFGQQKTGTLGLPSEVDAYSFTVSAADLAAGGGQYLAKLSLSSETTVDYKPRSRVYSPSGETVGQELNSGDTKTLTLTQAGTYVIQVYDNDYTHTQTELINRGKAPEYTVHLQDAQPPFIQSVTVSDPLLSDLDAGPANFGVTVVFSETMDPATMPTLVYGNSAVTGGLTPTLSNPSVNWSASTVANDTLTITYDVADRGLNAADITIGVTGAKDLAGNLQQGYSPEPEFSIDTLNPVVTLFTPRDNATQVAPTVNLVMAFGELIQKGSGSITIKRSSDGSTVETIPVAGAQVTVSGATATIDPAGLLLEGTSFYVEVSAGAFRDLAGNDFAGINGGATWNFTTGDYTPPALVSVSPADEATDVAWDTNLLMVFNEAVRPGIGQITIKRSSDGLMLETISVSGSQVSVSGTTVTIDPSVALADNTTYFVEVTGGAIEDSVGNAFSGISGPSAWNFTAADVPPAVLALSPPDEAAGVLLEANLLITFNQPIQKGTGNIVIKRSSDGSTFQTISVQDALVTVSGPQATIHPATVLERRMGYYVEIAAGAFEDHSGQPFAGISGSEAWDFTTVGPLVSDDAVTTKEDTPVNIDVLSNDLGIGRPLDPATLAIAASPTHGTVVIHNGSVIYTPAANFSGSDAFRYTVRDVVGFGSEEATVTITVTEVPDYQNPDLREDVNRSGAVTPLDVLAGINRINAYGGQLPPDPLPPAVPDYYYDVDGNNRLEPLDLLIIINYLNASSASAHGEGEGGDGVIQPFAAPAAERTVPLPGLELAGTDGGAEVRQRIRSTTANSELAARRGTSPNRTGAKLAPPAWSCPHDTALAAFQQQTPNPHSIALDDVLSLLAEDAALGAV